MDLYQEHILDHYQHPRHRGRLSRMTGTASVHNPLCGDRIVCDVESDGTALIAIAHEGEGCAISQAAMSILAEKALTTDVAALRALGPEDIQTLVGVPLSPTRLRCALLSLEALQTALGPNKDAS